LKCKSESDSIVNNNKTIEMSSDEDRYNEDFNDIDKEIDEELNEELESVNRTESKTNNDESNNEKNPRRRRRRKIIKKKKKKKKKTIVRASSSRDSYSDGEPYGFSDSNNYPEYMGDGGDFGYGDEEDDGTMDRFVATRRESARIMSKRFMERNEVKAKIMREREKVHRRLQRSKKKKENQWRRKMERSPFMVDLIAENERIDEENKVRLEEDSRRERMLHRRKEKIKNEIVLKALSEVSDLDALRREKRLIADEEKRLKALLIMEKANAHTKGDLMAAQRAERQRKQVQAQYRRARLREETQKRRELETELLREKLAAPPEEAFTYFSKTLG
jgi:hypothetical protein